MTEPSNLTIRAFAEASRLSIKALRLYDELGLLPRSLLVRLGTRQAGQPGGRSRVAL